MTARWLELCLDLVEDGDQDAMIAFWSRASGLRHRPGHGPGDPGSLVDPDGHADLGIALCPVPEPVTVKQRVHLDVVARSVDDLVAAGGRVLDVRPRWTVLADPDGGELCAFVRDDPGAPRIYELCVDSGDAAAAAAWWGERFGVPVLHEGDDTTWGWLEDVPGMPFEALVFVPVPEPKTVKNRLHWDVTGEVGEFLDAGAVLLAERPRWSVLADPEGNEFCVFPPA